MPQANENLQGLAIWEALIPQLWCDVCALLLLCRKADRAGVMPSAASKEISGYFQKLVGNLDEATRAFQQSVLKDRKGQEFPNPYLTRGNDDEHLRMGLFTRHSRKEHLSPRLASLVVNAFHQAREGHVESKDSEILPSPLFIICQFLTDPDDISSGGYAFHACRNWLSDTMQVWPSAEPRTVDAQHLRPGIVMDVRDLSQAMVSFENHERIKARWPNPRHQGNDTAKKQLRANTYVGHLLSLKGSANMWFRRGDAKNAGSAEAFLTISPSLRAKTDAREALNDLIALKLELPRFRKATQHHVFPDFEDIANQVFGIPLPIKGMDVALNGGLRTSDKGGLVMSIQGAPGTGKTSLALAIANALAPFGIPTSFIALEESEGDVRNKLSLVNRYGRSRLSITQANELQFFCVDSHSKDIDSFESLAHETLLLSRAVADSLKERAGLVPRTPFAGVVVIDNVNMLTLSRERVHGSRENDIEHVAAMIKDWRESRLLAIIISAEDVATDVRINYLADVVVEMRFKDLDETNKKPLRILNIVKTRHQSARQGAHLFHMTSGKGFRLVPHMDSLMAKKAGIRRRLPDRSQTLDIFQAGSGDKSTDRFLKVYPASNLLVHGFGSGGKAGLALKILSKKPSADPNHSNESRKQRTFPPAITHLAPRVLIVSFLYPEEYYEQLLSRIMEEGGKEILGEAPSISPMILSPGFLTPQDFLNMVVSRLDEAIVAGRPFTGVMIDGLHNVFLQYELLQDSSVVWAMLYSILSRYSISVVSTFTNFSLSDRLFPATDTSGSRRTTPGSIEDRELMQKGMTPFLHALVKAADFYLYLQEEIDPSTDKRIYVLSVRSAIGQSVPEDFLLWDRQAISFTERLTPLKLREKFHRSAPTEVS